MHDTDDPFYGDDATRLLQQRRDAEVEEMMNTPGAVGHARAFTSDDPETLGWDKIREVFVREGFVSLRGIDEEMLQEGLDQLADMGPVAHRWDIFLGTAKEIRASSTPMVARGLPAGITRQVDETIDWASLHEMQAFLSEHGVSPFSKLALSGELFPAKPVILRKPDGAIAAAAFAGITHNAYSWLHDIAWVGLVAVDPELRGFGLGKTVDAMANLVAVDELGAKGATEFAAPDNAASRAVLMACGLTHTGRKAIIYSRSTQRMTR